MWPIAALLLLLLLLALAFGFRGEIGSFLDPPSPAVAQPEE